MEQERELLKGNTPTLILAVLRDEPRHGYAIAREVERLSNSELKFRDGTLYPALQQLEQAKLIVGAWEATDNAPPRKVYRITQEGRESSGAAYRRVETLCRERGRDPGHCAGATSYLKI